MKTFRTSPLSNIVNPFEIIPFWRICFYIRLAIIVSYGRKNKCITERRRGYKDQSALPLRQCNPCYLGGSRLTPDVAQQQHSTLQPPALPYIVTYIPVIQPG
ncbi:hypothetical protein CBM2633_U10116 [Cupriavidus taiwanensis]|nr:hypothetical protein CBM2633_U10116 [Cupriavidus taiwanensis]